MDGDYLPEFFFAQMLFTLFGSMSTRAILMSFSIGVARALLLTRIRIISMIIAPVITF